MDQGNPTEYKRSFFKKKDFKVQIFIIVRSFISQFQYFVSPVSSSMVMLGSKGRLDFLNSEPPANYIAGAGRGASSFTTRSDIGRPHLLLLLVFRDQNPETTTEKMIMMMMVIMGTNRISTTSRETTPDCL